VDGPVEAGRLRSIVDEVFRGLGLGAAPALSRAVAPGDGCGALRSEQPPGSMSGGPERGRCARPADCRPAGSRLVASARLTGGAEVIALTLDCSALVAAELASRMVGRPPADLHAIEISDALGEIANILAGHVRADASEFTLGLPVVEVETGPVGSATVPGAGPVGPEVLCAVQVATVTGLDDEACDLNVRLERVGGDELARGGDGLV